MEFVSKCIEGCKNAFPCPNVRPGYKYHTEDVCQKCGMRFLWGIDWDQEKEKEFICNSCRIENVCGKPHNNGEESCLECEIIKSNK